MGVSSEKTKDSRDSSDQGDRRELSEDDQRDHRNSSMESLCIKVENLNEDKRVVEDYVNDERKSNIKWNDVDHLDNVSVLRNHLDQMEIKDRQEDIKKRDGKGKDIELTSEPEKITTLEEMVTLLDLMEHVHVSLLNKETLRKRFDEMVKWFIKGVLKQSSSWPPIIDNQFISLYDLYLSVRINGGKEKVSINNFWILLAADLGLDSRKGYKLMFIYNEYLDPMEWFNKITKTRMEQQGSYTFEQGESSGRAQHKEKAEEKTQHKEKSQIREEKHLPYKKRRVQVVRDWPPGCRPTI
ncbi:hypothetical protein E3N88_09931 [Mikania micrantha]|uniref:ARID domain-containing protein n=1 Tax=Mikania micrantha TaxID=192012 RepID=A0A5N6P984_9ASTR|nr:hypothetical protein E3N88_09931 [Mikania micrantha]